MPLSRSIAQPHSSIPELALACILFVFWLLLGSGCSPSPSSATPSKPNPNASTIRIAIVPRGVDDPVWPIMKSILEKENVRVDTSAVLWEAQIPEWSLPASQATLLRTLDAKKYRGLVVFPADSANCTPPLEALARSGVVVVTVGVRLPSDLLNLHCAEDSRQIGERVAELTAALAKDKGTIGLVHLEQDHPLWKGRLFAFEQRLREYSWADVLVRVDAGGDAAQARQRFEEAFNKYPRTKLWVSLSGWPIQLSNRTPLVTVPDGVTLVVTDPSPLQGSAIQSGLIAASVGVDYRQMVERGVRICRSLCVGDLIQVQQHTMPAETVDQANLKLWIDRWNE